MCRRGRSGWSLTGPWSQPARRKEWGPTALVASARPRTAADACPCSRGAHGTPRKVFWAAQKGLLYAAFFNWTNTHARLRHSNSKSSPDLAATQRSHCDCQRGRRLLLLLWSCRQRACLRLWAGHPRDTNWRKTVSPRRARRPLWRSLSCEPRNRHGRTEYCQTENCGGDDRQGWQTLVRRAVRQQRRPARRRGGAQRGHAR